MSRDDIIRMAREAGLPGSWDLNWFDPYLEPFAALVAAAEREALERELLKLKQGVAANSDYIQGRWDLIGEFQDVIRARGQA